jgi:myosin heavy subunit
MGEMATLQLAHLVLAGVQDVHPEILLSCAKNSMVPLREVLGELVEHFPRRPSESQCSDRAWCASKLYTKQNRLFLSLLGLYNMATAQSGSDLIMKSFMRRVEQSMPSLDCAFSTTTTPKAFRGSLTLRDRHGLSSTKVNRNWRSGVTELFVQNAQTSHDSMMRKIEDTCSDLERRCYDVEGPLRAAEEERDIYASENEQLKRQNKELNEQLCTNNTEVQTKLQNSHECFVELGHEKTRLEQLLQGQYEYTEELTVSLASTREELQQQQRSSEKALLEEKEKARSKELEMMANLTGKDDQLEELQEEMCSLQMKNEQTRQSLDQVTSEKAKLSEHCSSLEQELASATEALKQTRLLADEREDEVNRLLAQEEELRKELGTVETTVSLFDRLFSINQYDWSILILSRLHSRTLKSRGSIPHWKNLRKDRGGRLKG